MFTGKSGNKDVCAEDKFKEDGDPWSVEAQAAFLGPILWDKTLPYDADLKVPQVSIHEIRIIPHLICLSLYYRRYIYPPRILHLF